MNYLILPVTRQLSGAGFTFMALSDITHNMP